MDITSFVPNEVKERIFNGVVDFLAGLAKSALGDKVAEHIRSLSSDRQFRKEFHGAMDKAVRRFIDEYALIDPPLVEILSRDQDFWKSNSLQIALQTVIKRPGRLLQEDQGEIVQSFDDVLPDEMDRERVNHAITFILSCLADELWDLPALMPVYQTLFQRITAERAVQIVHELRGMRDETKLAMASLIQAISEQKLRDSAQELLPSGTILKAYQNLPNVPYEFVGRKDELAKTLKHLEPYPKSRYHLITIDGIGGVGKTALALAVGNYYVREYATLVKDERFDAIIWASAKKSELTPSEIRAREQSLRNVGDIFSAIARTLRRSDIISASQEQQDHIVQDILTQKRCLLIVDNFESIDDPKIMRFLQDLPDPTKAIITTRHRIDGAIPIRLEGLPLPDALKLIDQECQRQPQGVAISPDDRDRLANDTSGVPLAIVWTIGQIGYGSPVDDALLKLKSAGENYAKFCFEESLRLLEQKHKEHVIRLLMSLSLFADSATREALGHVSGIQDSSTRDEGIVDLSKLSLINSDGKRFSLLSLTKEYAQAQLATALQFRKEATNRWLNWHVLLTKQAGGGKTDLDASVLENLKVEHSNILWAIDYSYRTDYFDKFVELVRGMEFFWFGTGHWNEYERQLERGRNFAPKHIDKIHFAARLAWLDVMREDFKKARNHIAFANELLEELPDSREKRYEKMRVEDFTGQLYMEMGLLEEAESHLRESLDLAREIPDRRGIFACLKYLGEVYCKRGDAQTAKKLLLEAEPWAAGTREDQWIRGLAHAFHLRGLISNTEENWDDAVIAFQQCIDYLKIWPDERLLTRARLGLALAKYKQNMMDEARILLQDNKQTFQKLGMRIKIQEMETLLAQWN